jgi:hypothetical protein
MKKKELTPEQIEKNKKIIKFGCLPIIIISVIIYFIVPGSKEKKNKDHSLSAYAQAQELVKQSLKYPSEANFDWTPKYDKNEGNENYRIVGHLTAKNGFGVKEDQTFKCVLHYNGGDELEDSSWKIIEPISIE